MKLQFAAGLLLAATLASPQLLPPNSQGMTMGHVHLNVADIAVQTKFWVEQFGATPLRREGLAGVRIPGMLILFTQQTPTGGSEGTIIDHIGLKVPDTAEAVKRFREGGYEVQREFKGTEGFPNAYLVGPDKVRLELQQDTALTVKATSHHLHYFLAEPPVLREWYVKTLGMQSGTRGGQTAADIPGQNFTFGLPQGRPASVVGVPTKGRSLDHIGFEIANLEDFCRKLEAAGVKLDVPYTKMPKLGIAHAFITDPMGSYIELTEGLTAY